MDLRRHGAGHPRQLRPAASRRWALASFGPVQHSDRLVCGRCRGTGLAAQPHRIRPAALCHRRQPSGGPLLRHPLPSATPPSAYIITGLCVGLAAVMMMANVPELQPPGRLRQGNGDHPLAVVLGGCVRHRRQGLRLGHHHRRAVLRRSVRRLHPAATSPAYVQWVIMGAIMLSRPCPLTC